MLCKLWGVRGSIPTPLSASMIKSRISASLQRLTPEDLKSPEYLEVFMKRLPQYIFDTVGGNTPCIELADDTDTGLIVDAGTGLRELSVSHMRERTEKKEYHIFLTHFHWDHIQGIPFFTQLYKPGKEIVFYSPVKGFGKYIQNQMAYPYFPVQWNELRSNNRFMELENEGLLINGIKITWKKMKHPGDSFAYRFEKDGNKIVIATDSEIMDADFQKTEANTRFFENADLMIMDSQYTLEESINKTDWGHSSYSLAVDFASEWHAKKLVLFHHEPMYNDKKLFNIEKTANWYLKHLENREMEIMVGKEGMIFTI